MMTKPIDVDAYIADFPEETQKILQQIRAIIREVAPEADELISYGMPAYKLKGPLVYFAAYKNHIGFYPTPSGVPQLSIYKRAKGSAQFPLNKPMPLELITKIVQFRVEENLEKAKIGRQ